MSVSQGPFEATNTVEEIRLRVLREGGTEVEHFLLHAIEKQAEDYAAARAAMPLDDHLLAKVAWEIDGTRPYAMRTAKRILEIVAARTETK